MYVNVEFSRKRIISFEQGLQNDRCAIDDRKPAGLNGMSLDILFHIGMNLKPSPDFTHFTGWHFSGGTELREHPVQAVLQFTSNSYFRHFVQEH